MSSPRRSVEESPRARPDDVASCWLVVIYQGKRSFAAHVVSACIGRYCAVRHHGVTTKGRSIRSTSARRIRPGRCAIPLVAHGQIVNERFADTGW